MKDLMKKDTAPRTKVSSTPFGKWLVNQAARRGLTLNHMAVDAGLSYSALYKFVRDPRNKPDLRTVLKLSDYTGEPAEAIARLAGIAGYRLQESVSPDLQELIRIYTRLPEPMQRYLLLSARQLSDSMKVMKRLPARKK